MIENNTSSLEKPELLVLIHQLQSQNQKLQNQLEQLLRHIYGQKSEKFTSNDPQQGTFDFDLPVTESKQKEKETISYEREKSSRESNHKGRVAFPEHLPRLDEVRQPAEDTVGLKKIGEEVIIRPKYAKENNEGVLIADLLNMAMYFFTTLRDTPVRSRMVRVPWCCT